MPDLDIPSIVLITLNVVQMVSILFLLVPVIDIITLNKHLRVQRYMWRDSPLFLSLLTIYGIFIFIYGIIIPSKTLYEHKIPKVLKLRETPNEKLTRVVACTNAIRNSLLGAFSLFYTLVFARLLQYVKFSAKLHEFSDLMGNYDLIDATLNDDISIAEPAHIIYEDLDVEDDSVRWPSFVELNKSEHNQIKTFLEKEQKRKSDDKSIEEEPGVSNTRKKSIESEQQTGKKGKNSQRRRSQDSEQQTVKKDTQDKKSSQRKSQENEPKTKGATRRTSQDSEQQTDKKEKLETKDK